MWRPQPRLHAKVQAQLQQPVQEVRYGEWVCSAKVSSVGWAKALKGCHDIWAIILHFLPFCLFVGMVPVISDPLIRSSQLFPPHPSKGKQGRHIVFTFGTYLLFTCFFFSPERRGSQKFSRIASKHTMKPKQKQSKTKSLQNMHTFLGC
jgi:hypothetical protein